MRIVHINAYDVLGGAGKAAYRLHQALRNSGADSLFVPGLKTSDDESVVGGRSRIDRAMAFTRPHLDRLAAAMYRRRGPGLFSSSFMPDGFAKRVRALRPDVVNVHWLGQGFGRVESLTDFGAPVVWTMHDMWPFTGGCHLAGECIRYESKCGRCTLLGSRTDVDLSRWGWRRKDRVNRLIQIVYVAPSRWMARRASNSGVLRRSRVEVIPNGVDTQRFSPLTRDAARALLRIAAPTKVILFSALGGAKNPNKGFALLAEAVRAMTARQNLCLLVAGASSVPDAASLGVHVQCLGQLSDELSMAAVAGSADVLVAPSREDNLPSVVIEALASGTPAIAFDQGGMPDLIDHGVNGALVSPYDTIKLGQAIEWVLGDPVRWKALSVAARAKAEREFRIETQARRYLDLYENIIGRGTARVLGVRELRAGVGD
jgi:glycosyltransferase involved in cell wall biosynthesis